MPDLLPSLATVLAEDANVSDELRGAGIAFGTLVERTGAAVAATQLQLDTSSAATASALASTLVNVIAVRERVFRDDGTLDHVTNHVRPLPLISFIDPVFYQWTSVRLQGEFFAREFAASSESSSNTSSSSNALFGSGVSMFLGPGLLNVSRTSTSRTAEAEVSTDVSLGRIRASALLEPRDDVGIPKPNQVIRGPRLALIQGEIADEMDGGTLAGRTMSMLLQFTRRDGSAIVGKALSIETSGVPWRHLGAGVTDAAGQIQIELRRDFLDEDADTTPANFIITARIGLVSNSVTVTF
jgi:hypothetical protein